MDSLSSMTIYPVHRCRRLHCRHTVARSRPPRASNLYPASPLTRPAQRHDRGMFHPAVTAIAEASRPRDGGRLPRSRGPRLLPLGNRGRGGLLEARQPLLPGAITKWVGESEPYVSREIGVLAKESGDRREQPSVHRSEQR